MSRRFAATLTGALLLLLAPAASSPAPAAEDVLRPVRERFTRPDVPEVPDLQRHVLPLMSRVGCNGRACHGSFQGRGGFRLSLFGYDFQADHEALMARDEGRVDVEVPELSLILQKPTLAIPHEGGKVLQEESWEYNLLYRWLEGGAKPVDGSSHFERLEVTPSEIVFDDDGQAVPLRVVAHWADGSREDVTCITRFQTNDESIAAIDREGVVTSTGRGDTHVVAFYDNGVAAVPVLRPVSEQIGPKYPDVPTPTEVDALVVEKLKKLGIVPSEVCTDEEFLRRVSLDLTGTLPTPKEVETFLADGSSQKRANKIDELLARPTYAAWWTNRLCDILGNSPRNLRNNGLTAQTARNWYEWIYRRVAENRPYDELIAGIVLATSRQPGEDYEEFVRRESSYYHRENPADFTERETMPYFWARTNLRQPEEKALGFSYAFLGVRLDCAQCHKHPFDQWTQQDFQQFQAFFTPVRYGLSRDGQEMVRELQREMKFDPRKQNGNQFRQALARRVAEGAVMPWDEVQIQQVRRPTGRRDLRAARGSNRVLTPKVLGGEAVDLAQYDDPRAPVMQWMRDPENPYFARAWVNRVWAAYFGRGIVDPPDDLNLANPPGNEALLDYLAGQFVAHGFDMKWLHREILNSQTYQRSWRTNATNEHDERNFSRALVRRLPAEVMLDAVMQATARTGALDPKTVASSIETRRFGPAGTATYGRGGSTAYADRVFGRSARDTNCDCSRSDEPNLLQLIYLQNDQDVLGALDRRDGWINEHSGATQGGTQDAREVETLARQVRNLERRLSTAPTKGARAAESRRQFQDRLDQARARLKDQRAAAEQAQSIRPAEPEDLVREAYLRTLSRLPSTSEAAIAREHLAAAENRVDGLRDLLWALLNTKEFMTNH